MKNSHLVRAVFAASHILSFFFPTPRAEHTDAPHMRTAASELPVNVVFAAFSGGSINAPKRSAAQLRAQAYLRSFICSIAALEEAHLFLFLSPTPTYEFLKAHLGSHSRIHVLPATSQTGGVRLQHARYLEYLELLRVGRVANASKVVLADASDVVFQSDPFALIKEDRLYTAEEAASYTVGSHMANAMWVRETFGETTLQRLAQQRVVCSGLTMGSGAAVGNYLEHMVAESATRLGVARLDELKRKHGRDLCRGLDQGLHNVLVRTRLAPTTTVLPSRRSALFHGNEMHCDADVVLNGSRLSYAPTVDAAAAPPPIAIAHQFGRIRGGCQRAVRRALTCREEAPAARAAATVQSSAAAASSAAWWRRPSYCDVCAQLWPQWLGDSAESWRTSDQ